jgi:alkylmercury lyase
MSDYSVNHLAKELGRSLCRFGSGQCDLLANDIGLCRTLIRLLAQGKPVSSEVLAQASGRSQEDVLAVIHGSSNVELDGEGRIVGAGLSLQPTPHRLSVNGRLLYAWCALDALMYPALLDADVQVESLCAVSGAPVRARVSAHGVHDW